MPRAVNFDFYNSLQSLAELSIIYIKDHIWTFVRIIFLICVIIVMKSSKKLFGEERADRIEEKWNKIIEKAEDVLDDFFLSVKKYAERIFLLWSPSKSILILFLIILLLTLPIGKSKDVVEFIKDVSPYLLGAFTTVVIASFIIAVALYGSEKVNIGDMIEFENHVGRIKKVGLIYTEIETPKNEIIYIPNIMLSAKVMKRLSRQKIGGEKPYIAHFETTLSYEIPFGIVYCLFFLTIKDTVDDFENDLRKRRMKRGMECIRGIEENMGDIIRKLKMDRDELEEKIGELEKKRRECEKNINAKISHVRKNRNKIEKQIEEKFRREELIGENVHDEASCIIRRRLEELAYAKKEYKIEYDYDISELKKDRNILKERIEELENQQKEYKYTPYVLIKKLDKYTVNYEFCVFTDHPFYILKINHYLMKNLKRRFDEFGIEIMSPLQVSKREFNE